MPSENKCGQCSTGTDGSYVTWHRVDNGQVTDAGGAYLCAPCRVTLETSGAVVNFR